MTERAVTERSNLVGWVEKLGNARVLCVGDVMLDQFVYGRVDRISPEAPIPILQVEREIGMLGGAGNVVRNVSALGGTPVLAAVIGDDTAGAEIKALLVEDKVAKGAVITHSARATGIKTRYLAGTQQMLRADREVAQPIDGKVAQKVIDSAKKALKTCGAVVISDYGKGVLVPDVIEAVIDAARARGCPVIVDPKGREYWRYQGADLVTPNRAELAEAVGHPINVESDIVDAAKSLVVEYDLGGVLVTRSQEGMTLLTNDGHVTHLAAEAREVYDVSGAGDTVVATIATAMAAGAPLLDAAALANVAAGIVVAKVGTAAAYASDIVAALHHQDARDAEARILNLNQVLERVQRWQRQGLKVGFTNGCFDLLHPGHVSLLAQASAACDRLIVGLNSDASVKRLKGKDRPIQNESARLTVLASLETVDFVLLFSEDTPIKLIKAVKPDVLVKGADYSVAQVVGADVVKRYGGKVVLAKLEDGHSTTETISRLSK
jgi:D-beta-D-heptose 7-phosphate kinase/D-beta-D-heptose 1-phosphate adenosyltransferase